MKGVLDRSLAPLVVPGDNQTLPDISNYDCSIGGVTPANAVSADAVTQDAYAEHPLGEPSGPWSSRCMTGFSHAGLGDQRRAVQSA